MFSTKNFFTSKRLHTKSFQSFVDASTKFSKPPLHLLSGMCNKLLDSCSVAEHGAELFCKQCHGRKYGPKGVGFGLGAGSLTMDDGSRFGNTTTEMGSDGKPVAKGYDTRYSMLANDAGKQTAKPEQ